MRTINITKNISVKQYEANDGTIFENEIDCINYEKECEKQIDAAKSIESIDCNIPFTGWYMDAEESKIYILHSKNEYENLAKWYSSKLYSDSLFWEEPTKYPAAMLIISRECTSCGYCIDGKYVSDMFKAAQIITDAFYKTEM